MRDVQIDLDVHKRIEAARLTFEESDNDVLRRLLEIDSKRIADDGGPPWAGKGVTLPHGTEAKMEYNGRQHTARINNGAWNADGKSFGSPSAAAGGLARTKAGKRPSLDGWKYWYVRRPVDNDWTLLDTLRK